MLEGKRVLLLAATTGYQIRVFEEAARRLGLEVVLASDRCHQLDDPWGDHAIAVRFENPEQSAALLEQAGRERPFDGVVAVGDRPTYLAALVAERLEIPYSPPSAVAACRDKYLARQCFEMAGLNLPWFFRVGLDDDSATAGQRASYPCVLKPLGLSGSRGVIRADDPPGFAAAFERIKAILESRDVRRQREELNRFVQVESFIGGKEFAVEGIVTDGRLRTLALFDKPDPLDGPFFEETIYVTPSRENAASQAELIRATEEAVRALGLKRGPVHAEMRLNDRGVWMLEVAARPIGGLCSRALRFNEGITLEELILRHAVGEDVSSARPADPACGVMMIPIPCEGIYEDVGGVDRAAAVPGIDEIIITAKPGQRLIPLPEGSSYLGFLFARGQAPEEVEAALRAAHRELEFRICPVLPVLTP